MGTNKFEELKSILESVESDYKKFGEKGVKAAGVRIRKAMQDIKKIAQEIRVEVSQKNKEEA
jgi:hypothetical protein